MIIGLSGKAGVGKDTVADIIQYLMDYDRAGYSHPQTEEDFKSWKKNVQHLDEGVSGWKKKAYATKVKEICSILTGIPVSDFEDRDKKKKSLIDLTGNDGWKMYTIIPSHKSSSNPFTVSNEKDAKRIAKTYGLSMDRDKGIQSGTVREHSLTMRQLMQIVGTDCIREKVHPNAWILALYAEYKEYKKSGYDKYGEPESWLEYPNWIVTDCRFPNEGDAVKERGGIVWWIDRDVDTGDHPSETSMNGYDFDHYIDNGGDIDLLIPTVKHGLKKFDIL